MKTTTAAATAISSLLTMGTALLSTPAQAADYVNQMKKSHRYQKDVY